MTAQRRCDTYAWQKRWRVERARGLKRTTGPERAQAHVQGLIRDYGVTSRAISDAANISRTLLNELERGICTGLLVTSEEKILAVRPQHLLERVSPVSWVPSVGSRRRLQALAAIGWRHTDLNPKLGFGARTVMDQRNLITKRKHDAITRVYNELWDQPGPSETVRTRAAKYGWAPPIAWDDDTIDDPKAVPHFGAVVRGRGRPVKGAVQSTDAQLEDVEFLVHQALRWDDIAARLEVDPRSLERTLYRKGRRDLVSRAKNIAYARAS